jgi:hypothetical protein
MKSKLVKRIDGPTPNGGVYAEVSFTDKNGKPCVEEEAAKCTINEFAEDGTLINSVYSIVQAKNN